MRDASSQRQSRRVDHGGRQRKAPERWTDPVPIPVAPPPRRAMRRIAGVLFD
jgi:hypothetical protein